MEAATPVPSPRQEPFCRYAAFGHTLIEAGRWNRYFPVHSMTFPANPTSSAFWSPEPARP